MHVAGALNNDMVGWTNDARLDNTIRYSNPGIRDVQHGAAMLFTRLITYDALYFKGTDAASLYDAYGDVIGGIGSYPVLGSPHYHQSTDLLEFENHQLILETSKTTVASVMLLASSPSRLTNLKVDSPPAARQQPLRAHDLRRRAHPGQVDRGHPPARLTASSTARRPAIHRPSTVLHHRHASLGRRTVDNRR